MPGPIAKQFINELIDRADIVDLIQSRGVSLQKRGQNFLACCPFHHEKTPSFSVSPNKQLYHCFGCGAGGTAISFLMAYEHLPFLEAVEALAKYLGIELPQNQNTSQAAGKIQYHRNQTYDLLASVSRFYHHYLTNESAAQPARDYLTKRGISRATIKYFEIGFAPCDWRNIQKGLSGYNHASSQQLLEAGMLIKKEGGNTYDRFRNRIMFPIHDRRGRVIAFGGRALGDETPKYLNSPETPFFHKGNELYNFHRARQALVNHHYLFIVEGYMDVIGLGEVGIENSVATLGTAATPDHIQRLLRLCQGLVFCFDGDKAGRKAAWRALENLLPQLRDGIKVRFIFLPEGEDPDSLAKKEGKEAFLTRLNTAHPLSQFFFDQLTTQVDLGTLEGKAELIKLAAPRFATLPESAINHMMREQLAKLVRMDIEKIGQLIDSKHKQSSNLGQKIEIANTTSAIDTVSPMRTAIALLLQQPTLLAEIDDIKLFCSLQQKGGEILASLIELLQQCPHIKTSGILEMWRDKPYYRAVSKLAQKDYLIPEQGILEEFRGALLRLCQRHWDQQVERLLNKAAQSGLSIAEKEHLNHLIIEKHSITDVKDR